MNPTTEQRPRRERRVRAALWLPGLAVALGAAVATAHGLYEVARAAQAPPLIAGLYPLITDGLALVAYAATARLSGSAQRYAWTVVVLAAGLSGLAQASYLAHGVADATAALRFGVGAWPAIAAAIVAHLLFLIAHADRHADTEPAEDGQADADAAPDPANQPAGVQADTEEPDDTPPDETTVPPSAAADAPETAPDERPTVQLPTVQPDAVQPAPVQPDTGRPDGQPDSVQPDERPTGETSGGVDEPSGVLRPVPARSAQSPARDRAEQAAQTHRVERGELPTVAQLMHLADVSRGTAGEALKTLRTQPADLHLVAQPAQQEAHS